MEQQHSVVVELASWFAALLAVLVWLISQSYLLGIVTFFVVLFGISILAGLLIRTLYWSQGDKAPRRSAIVDERRKDAQRAEAAWEDSASDQLHEAGSKTGENVEIRNDDGAVLFSIPAASFKKAFLAKAYLRRAQLEKADLRGADFSDADLREANLRGADLRGAKLIDTVLCEADLTGADLRACTLRNTNFDRSTLNGANLRALYTLYPVSFVGAQMCTADLSYGDLCAVDFSGANLKRATLVGASIHNTNFNWTNLGGANLEDACFHLGCNLENAILYDTDLSVALDVSNASFGKCGARFNASTSWGKHLLTLLEAMGTTRIRRAGIVGGIAGALVTFVLLGSSVLSEAKFAWLIVAVLLGFCAATLFLVLTTLYLKP